MYKDLAQLVYGEDPNLYTYGFDIYHGDDDHGPVQFGSALHPTDGSPARKFCWAKSTQGLSYVDPRYSLHKHQADAISAAYPGSFLFGGYHFLTNEENAISQINHHLAVTDTAHKGSGYLLSLLDCETNPRTSTKPSINQVRAAYQHFVDVTGRGCVLYFGNSDYETLYKAAFPSSHYTICIARYASDSAVAAGNAKGFHPPTSRVAFHQYTGTGRLPPANSSAQPFDLDVYFGSFANLKSKLTY